MSYKIDLDKVWNLPIGIAHWASKGKYCAIGLVYAGIHGEVDDSVLSACEYIEYRERAQSLFIALVAGGIGDVGCCFDREIMEATLNVQDDPEALQKQKENIREKYVRKILNSLIETGYIQVEGSNISCLKELACLP